MNSTDVGASEKIAEHASSFHNIGLEPELIRQVKRVVLDFYCAAVTGSRTETSRRVYQYLRDAAGSGKYAVIGYPEGLPRLDSAFMNGTNAHCLDFDDGHSGGSIHPGAPVIPAVLAASWNASSTPGQFMSAVVLGYDVCLRIAKAMHPASRQRGFHNTPAAGIFGAAAASAFLYGATPAQMKDAIGIAGSFAGGLFAFLGTGSEVKRIHPGQAARDGLLSAELAMAGLTGPHNVLEGENGFFKAFAGAFSMEKLVEGLGEQFELMNVYFKPYPCCRHLHSSIDCIFEMKQLYSFDPKDISRVQIGVNRITSMHAHKQFQTLLDTQMSLPFSAAAALLSDHLNLQSFELASITPELTALCDKIDVVLDEQLEKDYPLKRGARIVVELANGDMLDHTVDNPLGEPSKPLTDEQLMAKFVNNCVPILGKEKTSRLAEAVMNLDHSLQFLHESLTD